ncbi:MAG TPA: head GIN domain-containing protein, partial [Salinimicrobium sp.]|nr:head GIN domain-containing protein [Salinimicrobium sp.]
MKRSLLTLSILALSLQTANAQWWSSDKEIEGNGNYTTETRSVSDYDEVNLKGSIDVVLVAGNEGNLKVEAESNLLEYIVTEVEDGILKISVEEDINLDPSGNKEIVVTVPFESLKAVALTGSGDINASDEIRAENFAVQITGSGDINLMLDAGTVQGKVVGSGDLGLEGKATELEFLITGSG